MKTIFSAIVLLLSFTTAFSQVKTDPAPPNILTPSQEQLLAESKAQKKIGKILLWGGIGLVIAGAATYDFYFTPLGGTQVGEEENDNTLSGVLAVAGLCSIVGGVVQLAAAKESKKKALSMVIRQKRIPTFQQGAYTLKTAPTVGLQFAF